MRYHDRERAALVETAAAADPDAPTLCEGWTVRHLVAHLVQRDQQPARFAVDQVERRTPGHERYLPEMVADASTTQGFRALLARLAAGPPAWSPVRWWGDAGNLIEYVVHHEDIRRGGPAPLPPRDLPLDLEHEVWRQIRRSAPLALRSRREGVILAPPGRTPVQVRRGSTPSTVQGGPVELALWLAGRRQAARVTTFAADDEPRAADRDEGHLA